MELNMTHSAALPLPSTPGDFDYAAFLEDDEMDYAAGDDNAYSGLSDSSSQNRESSSSRPAAGADAESSALTRLVAGSESAPGKQRLERRGHTKSRRGCFNCKRRRIKASFFSAPHHTARNPFEMPRLPARRTDKRAK
jgi:hypothetical protein